MFQATLWVLSSSTVPVLAVEDKELSALPAVPQQPQQPHGCVCNWRQLPTQAPLKPLLAIQQHFQVPQQQGEESLQWQPCLACADPFPGQDLCTQQVTKEQALTPEAGLDHTSMAGSVVWECRSRNGKQPKREYTHRKCQYYFYVKIWVNIYT